MHLKDLDFYISKSFNLNLKNKSILPELYMSKTTKLILLDSLLQETWRRDVFCPEIYRQKCFSEFVILRTQELGLSTYTYLYVWIIQPELNMYESYNLNLMYVWIIQIQPELNMYELYNRLHIPYIICLKFKYHDLFIYDFR